jgi:bacterioferritin-associated ferredoxin
MADLNALRSLADELEKVSGPDRSLDFTIAEAVGECPHSCVNGVMSEGVYATCSTCGKSFSSRAEWASLRTQPKRFTASIDAALALVERLLPSKCRDISDHCGVASCALYWDGEAEEDKEWFAACSVPLAILRALVAALVAKEEGHA